MRVPMPEIQEGFYKKAVRLLFVAAGLVILLWFFKEITGALLLLLLVIIFFMTFNAPVAWLVSKKMNRTLATTIVFVITGALLGVLLWLIIPRVSEQVKALIVNLPTYITQAENTFNSFFKEYPAMTKIFDSESQGVALSSLPSFALKIGRFSLGFVEFVALMIFIISMIIYMVASPRPLLELYINSLPERSRAAGMRAYIRTSEMVVGWMKANVIVGGIQAVIIGFFLSYIGIPGFLIWSLLAFFAELVPKIGMWIMAFPPVILAFAISPMTALWVFVFYAVLNELMGLFVSPRIRSKTMDIHATSVLFVMLALGSAFGLLGALIATPVAAFIKAYYEEFYLLQKTEDPRLEERVDAMLSNDGSFKEKNTLPAENL